jgi:hypothetical protein
MVQLDDQNCFKVTPASFEICRQHAQLSLAKLVAVPKRNPTDLLCPELSNEFLQAASS